MKRINWNDWERFQKLHERLIAEFETPPHPDYPSLKRQTASVSRGEYRAIQWAAWWIREVISESKRETKGRN